MYIQLAVAGGFRYRVLVWGVSKRGRLMYAPGYYHVFFLSYVFVSSFYIVLLQCYRVSVSFYSVFYISLRLQWSVSGQAVTMNSTPSNLDCCIGNAASSVLTTLMILSLVSMITLSLTPADISLSSRFFRPSCADSVRKITTSMPWCLGLLRKFFHIPVIYIRGWFTTLPHRLAPSPVIKQAFDSLLRIAIYPTSSCAQDCHSLSTFRMAYY